MTIFAVICQINNFKVSTISHTISDISTLTPAQTHKKKKHKMFKTEYDNTKIYLHIAKNTFQQLKICKL